MGKKSKTPEAPDYSGIAAQQAAASKGAWTDALQANRANQSNQFGNLSWTQDPTTGQWTQSTTLNQPQQDIFNQQQANQQQIANMGGGMLGQMDTSQIDFSGAPKMGEVGGFNQQATDLYNQLAAPELQRSQDSQRARAAAMGIPEFGSRAGTTMNQQLADQSSRSAMMGAQAGIQQGNTMFGQQNQLHQQGISDIVGQRQANLGQLQGLMGLGQAVGTPQFGSYSQTNPYQVADMSGAAQQQYGANLDKTNAANADKANTMKTVGTVASIAAMAF